MCGVAGYWASRPEDRAFSDDAIRAMTDALVHRGPDDAGSWRDASAGVVLGHRRLSILDLSADGHQPMLSASGRYVVSYNGEVYNFRELREELERLHLAPQFRGHSDTEVILACVEAWGVDAAVRRFIGMFAIALWDRHQQTLHLIRDRLGIKPLFVGTLASGLVFASELAPFSRHPHFPRSLDEDAIRAFVQAGYVPAPRCIYRGVRKVRPGTMLTFRSARLEHGQERVYWSAVRAAIEGTTSPLGGDDDSIADQVEAALRDAVRLRMVADVPLGAFLSGGIDSSTVVAMMQSQSNRPVRTFSIGNESSYYDESAGAAAVAAHLGCEHTALVVTAEHALEVVPRLPEMYDEPFADSSQIPTFIVSRLARGSVTVALSGDGGDEVFGGYNRHVWAPRVWKVLSAVPDAVSDRLGEFLTRRSPTQWDDVFASAGRLAPRVRRPGQQVHKLASVMSSGSLDELYASLCRLWPPSVVPGFDRDTGRLRSPVSLDGAAQELMLVDSLTYLPDDILTKVDRASMAVSLEARVPLLDHRVVELAWRLPQRVKVRGSVGKWVLRKVLERYVPPRLFERPKMGFTVPLGEWLRGPLLDWTRDLLSVRALADSPFLAAAPILRTLDEHVSGARDWGQRLWAIAVLQQWKRHWRL